MAAGDRRAKRNRCTPLVGALALVLAAAGCSALRPSNDRNWVEHQAVLPTAEIDGEQVTIRHVRNCRWITADDYVLDYEDRTYDLAELQNVDFIVIPFQKMPALAHTMLSFGFADGRYLALSVEVRCEEGETYSALKGALRQYELMYVLADERDVVQLRTSRRGDDVYVYRTMATPEQARTLLLDVAQRVNKLAREPEFYDTVTNNCTSNLAQHVRSLRPEGVPPDPRMLLSGFADRLAFEQGLLETGDAQTWAEARQMANVSSVARRTGDGPDFSQAIRR
jgi:hypothetical protein